jgi:flavin-dependent dehydrogenase
MPLALDNVLAATIPLHAAAERVWDVAVVGAGPAGSLAARQAALLGAQVLLIDRAAFPRWKVCGCCLNAAAVDVLESVGLGDLPRRLGARPLRTIRLAAGRGLAECALPGGVSLSREAFDAELANEAILAGASFLPETEATLSPCSDAACRRVQLRCESGTVAVRARVVLAADGLAGRLLHDEPGLEMRIADGSRLGAGTVLDAAPSWFEDGVIFMASGAGGYVGLVRLEDGRLDVAAALDREAVRRHGAPGMLAAAILDEAGLPVPPGLAEAAWRGTPPLTRRPARVATERLLVVGDAAGYIEPFTGEGMAWALAGAAAVAPFAVLAAADWSESIARAWEDEHARIIGGRRNACRWVSRLLRRPWWCSAAVAALRVAPWLATPLVRAINRPFDRARATSAGRAEVAVT